MKKILSLFLAFALICCSAFVFAETATTTVTGTGSAAGYGGEITVTVELTDGIITDVKIIGDDETPGIGSKIIEEYRRYLCPIYPHRGLRGHGAGPAGGRL